jgi:hypothetical protein
MAIDYAAAAAAEMSERFMIWKSCRRNAISLPVPNTAASKLSLPSCSAFKNISHFPPNLLLLGPRIKEMIALIVACADSN